MHRKCPEIKRPVIANRSITVMTLVAFVAILVSTHNSADAQNEQFELPQIHHLLVRLPDGTLVECGPANDGSGEFIVLAQDPDDGISSNDDVGGFWTVISQFLPQTPMGWFLFVFGIAGQMMFTGRVLVQWIASERAKQSVVPVAYWWFSLAGASMLLAYFLLRFEPIGILGQSFGWIVYTRNLYLIGTTHQRGHSVKEDLPPGDPAGELIPDPNAEA